MLHTTTLNAFDQLTTKLQITQHLTASTPSHPPGAPSLPLPLTSDLRLLLHHPSFLSRRFPIQFVSVASRLVLLAASTLDLSPALPHPLSFGPALSVSRRWCTTGSLDGSVYVASGIGSQFSIDVARSLERWDHNDRGSSSRAHERSKLNELKDGRFCRDAIEAVGWKEKLCIFNMGNASSKQGVVYDTESETWREMKEGMLKGWRGLVVMTTTFLFSTVYIIV